MLYLAGEEFQFLATAVGPLGRKYCLCGELPTSDDLVCERMVKED